MVHISKNNKLKWVAGAIALLAAAIIAIVTGATLNIKVDIEDGNLNATVIYTDEAVEATVTDEAEVEAIESGQGEIKIDGYPIPNVEAVESNSPVTDVSEPECPEGEECGRGAAYPKLDISSPQAFANATLGQCINVDGYYGAQCWDLMAAFWYNYTGRTLSTCGTGAAKGAIADGCWQKNAGDEFVMIWDKTKVQDGDIAFYSTGQWGHTGMAMGVYNNGYFTLLGQNQGGKACPGGGAATNIINLSTRDFIGAFRPKIYIKPEPKPEPTPAPVVDQCKVWNVKKGDTLGKIMQTCRGKIEWGAAMNEYASHWYSTKYKRYLTVYDGWASPTGYGLFAGDTIEYRD